MGIRDWFRRVKSRAPYGMPKGANRVTPFPFEQLPSGQSSAMSTPANSPRPPVAALQGAPVVDPVPGEPVCADNVVCAVPTYCDTQEVTNSALVERSAHPNQPVCVSSGPLLPPLSWPVPSSSDIHRVAGQGTDWRLSPMCRVH